MDYAHIAQYLLDHIIFVVVVTVALGVAVGLLIGPGKPNPEEVRYAVQAPQRGGVSREGDEAPDPSERDRAA